MNLLSKLVSVSCLFLLVESATVTVKEEPEGSIILSWEEYPRLGPGTDREEFKRKVEAIISDKRIFISKIPLVSGLVTDNTLDLVTPGSADKDLFETAINSWLSKSELVRFAIRAKSFKNKIAYEAIKNRFLEVSSGLPADEVNHLIQELIALDDTDILADYLRGIPIEIKNLVDQLQFAELIKSMNSYNVIQQRILQYSEEKRSLALRFALEKNLDGLTLNLLSMGTKVDNTGRLLKFLVQNQKNDVLRAFFESRYFNIDELLKLHSQFINVRNLNVCNMILEAILKFEAAETTKALSKAVDLGMHELVGQLLSRGAKPAVESDGKTLLHKACENLDVGMVLKLLKGGFDANLSTKKGILPIISLAMLNYNGRPEEDIAKSLEIAELLLKEDIELDTFGPDGLLPWELAQKSGNDELAQLLYENTPLPQF